MKYISVGLGLVVTLASIVSSAQVGKRYSDTKTVRFCYSENMAYVPESIIDSIKSSTEGEAMVDCEQKILANCKIVSSHTYVAMDSERCILNDEYGFKRAYPEVISSVVYHGVIEADSKTE